MDTDVVESGRRDARITINYAFAPTASRDWTVGFSMGTSNEMLRVQPIELERVLDLARRA